MQSPSLPGLREGSRPHRGRPCTTPGLGGTPRRGTRGRGAIWATVGGSALHLAGLLDSWAFAKVTAPSLFQVEGKFKTTEIHSANTLRAPLPCSAPGWMLPRKARWAGAPGDSSRLTSLGEPVRERPCCARLRPRSCSLLKNTTNVQHAPPFCCHVVPMCQQLTALEHCRSSVPAVGEMQVTCPWGQGGRDKGSLEHLTLPGHLPRCAAVLQLSAGPYSLLQGRVGCVCPLLFWPKGSVSL